MQSLLPSILSLVAEAEAHAAEAASSGGIGAIGIDGKALLFQVINFAILLFILKKVAYKPILEALENRRKTIEASVEQANEIEQANQELEGKQARLLAKARAEADAITASAQKQAAAQLAETEAKAQKRAEQIIADGRNQISEDVKKAKTELKKETLSLVVQATETIIDEKLDATKDAQLLEKALSGGHRE